MKPAAIVALIAATLFGATTASAEAPQDIQAAYAAQAGAGFTASAQRGRTLFTARHGVSADFPACTQCHGNDLAAAGKHAITGKQIEPMAVRANPQRFTDAAKTEKWFRRNCREVVGRDCSAAEKADVIAFLRAGS
ncbi:DUF1924 domain-containing protein [Niveibacterium sp.]|uniref:DUF1924 domain-containing protein n=1 Tax=Niveibacterium sp. TaxID=2017444 RepID=UPI0035B13CBA